MARGKRGGVETKKKILSPCVVGTRRSKTDRSMERSVFFTKIRYKNRNKLKISYL